MLAGEGGGGSKAREWLQFLLTLLDSLKNWAAVRGAEA